MELDVINRKLDQALQKVMKNDQYLLIHDINEPTICHRLALYLESSFPGFNVDCEYNGNVDSDNGRKYIGFLKFKAIELGILKEGEDEEELIYRSVYPDIIVHKRGYNGSDNNLLIIEVKKSSNPNSGAWDAVKLSCFTSSEHGNNFNYQFGVFVKFNVEGEIGFSTQWYQNGQELP